MSKLQLTSRHVLLRYLSGALLTRVLFCCCVLVSLLEILALLEQTTPILQRHLGVMGILDYAAMRVPFLLSGALPLSTLIGALLMLTQMTLASEMAILRAAGLSTLGLYKYLVPATLLLGLAGVVLDDQITPLSEQALAAWWNRTDPSPEDGHSFWFHDGTNLNRIGYVADGGNILGTVDVYVRNPEHMLSKILHAKTAHYTKANGWTLYNVEGLDIDLKGQKVDRLDARADMHGRRLCGHMILFACHRAILPSPHPQLLACCVGLFPPIPAPAFSRPGLWSGSYARRPYWFCC
nr:LptF/LptG family permease [Acetobacter okinawensis]